MATAEARPDDRLKLDGYVSSIVEKAVYDRDCFAAKVKRAISGRMTVV
jgi:hypothetical protein